MTLSFRLLVPVVFALASLPCNAAPTQAVLDEEERREEQQFRRYETAYARVFDEMRRSLRSSASPRDWALATQLYKPQGLAEREDANKVHGRLLRRAAEAAPNDRLVQWIWANAQADASGCDARHPCPDRAAALAILEPDNAAAWMPVLHDAFQRKDARETDMAVSRMAAAPRYDDLFVESVLAWSAVYRRFPLMMPGTPDTPATVFIRAAAVSAAMAVSSVSAVRACDRSKVVDADPSRFVDCGRIGRTMQTTASTLIGRVMGRGFLRTSGNLEFADSEVETERWLSFHTSKMWMAWESDPTFVVSYAEDLKSTRSEILAMQLQLERAGIALRPPPGWKPDYGELR